MATHRARQLNYPSMRASPGAYNYIVQIVNDSDGPGALNVGSILLTPTGDHYSTLQFGSSIAREI